MEFLAPNAINVALKMAREESCVRKLIELSLVVLFASTIFVPSVAVPLSSVHAAEEPFKVKGFYIGMDIQKAREQLAGLLNDQGIIADENTEGEETIFSISNFSKAVKEDLRQIPSRPSPADAGKVWEGLMKVGYINKKGAIKKFGVWEIPPRWRMSAQLLVCLPAKRSLAGSKHPFTIS